jgi:DNA repair exonuclease SbcCD ATPase subunit
MSTTSNCHVVGGKDEQPAASLTNPNLSSNLRSEYEALRNDVEQANELAAELQRQLSGKSNEVAEFKQLFEKTQRDLGHLQASINELRQERHRLANEAMRVVAFERKLADVTAERNRLKTELHVLRQSLTTSAEDSDRRLRERDAEITRLSQEVDNLHGKSRGGAAGPVRAAGKLVGDPAVRTILAELRQTFERLQMMLDPNPESASALRATSQPGAADDTFIDIEFDK